MLYYYYYYYYLGCIIKLIGDIHGKWQDLNKILRNHKQIPGTTILMGDIGVGFPRATTLTLPTDTFFIRGNHDNPAVAKAHPQHLGDYGYKEIDGHRTFYVAGAWSIDQAFRTEDRTWWRDEELSIPELNAAHEQYVDTKPDIMLTHDGPNQATTPLLNRYAMFPGENPVIKTRTGQALTAMFEAYQPKVWIFGHWHATWRKEINGTLFICLNELEWLDVDKLMKERK